MALKQSISAENLSTQIKQTNEILGKLRITGITRVAQIEWKSALQPYYFFARF
jgi:hypothetical protein